MRCTINSDTLDITEWQGKKQRLQTSIERDIYQKHLEDLLPYKLIMTIEQYEMLKNTVEFGEKGQWRTHPPQDRIYKTDYNVMEIIIK